MINYIYSLHDPLTLEQRYIGKSSNPEKRYKQHLKPYYLRPDTYKNRWLKSLLAKGLKPAMLILCECEPWEDINRIEKDFIRWLGGNRLTNTTLGGDGGATNTGRKLPPRGESPMKGIKWAIDDPRREQLRDRLKGKPFIGGSKGSEINKCQWELVSPEGTTHTVHGITEISSKYGLNPTHLASIARGNAGRKTHKGWVCRKLED